MKIRISLPHNRDYAGRLEVLDANDAVIFGPVAAAGRAHDVLAAAFGNTSRNPLRLYGDTPLGTYLVRGVIESGLGTELDAEEFGRTGVLLLEPASGQAALADAHGRLRLFIQGGRDEDGLRATAGSVRLRDADQVQLVALVRRGGGRVLCEILPTAELGAPLCLTWPPRDRDPPGRLGRSGAELHPSAKHASSSKVRVAAFAPRMFVVPVTSGSSGGTGYGGTGGGSAAGADLGVTGTPGPNDTNVSPLPATGVDVAPTPGADLNPSPDQTQAVLAQSGGSQLLSSSPPTGLSDPYQPPANNPYTDTPAGNPTLTPYIGADVALYSSDLPNQVNANTTDPDNPAPAPVDSTQGTFSSYAPQRDTLENQDAAIQAMVTRFAQDDADLRAAQAAQWSQPDLNATPTQPPATGSPAYRGSASSPSAVSPGAGVASAPSAPAEALTSHLPDELSWTGSLADQTLRSVFAPVDTAGNSLAGPLNLWSGSVAQTAAENAPGYVIGQTPYAGTAQNAVQDLRARIGVPTGRVPPPYDDEYTEIWATASRSAVRDAALSGSVTSQNDLSTLNPNSIQAQDELPTLKLYGAGSGALGIGAGFLRIYGATQQADRTVAALGYTSGTLDALGGGAVLAGALNTSAPLMQAGRVLGTAGAAFSAPISAYALDQDLSHGHWFDAAVDASAFGASSLIVTGRLAASALLTDAGLVLGSFGVGVLVGTGIDKGLELASRNLIGVDLSPSSIISWGLTGIDYGVSNVINSLWGDPSRPQYTQTIAWKILEWTE